MLKITLVIIQNIQKSDRDTWNKHDEVIGVYKIFATEYGEKLL